MEYSEGTEGEKGKKSMVKQKEKNVRKMKRASDKKDLITK
jgi:hypothetical protein